MVKIETLGMLDVAKVNPVITSATDVANYSFITHEENVYLVANTLMGDDAHREDVIIKAGEYLNGYLVKAWEGQKLVVDAKHIDGEYDTYSDDDTTLIVDASGKLKQGSKPAAGGIYFAVDGKCTLTEQAVKVKVCVA